MMAINDELIQRMHTIAEADESTYNDNDSLDSMFLAEQEVTMGQAVGRHSVGRSSTGKVTRKSFY